MSEETFTLEQKAAILVENAMAYYQKGPMIQYDQYSMDRFVRVTPRNTRFASPETANAQHTLFLDCSTFVYSVYLQTFGQQLESNLTWHIPHMLGPCVYEKKLNGEETQEEKTKIREEILSVLQPGDVINKVRVAGSGHIMLYIGNGEILHSRAAQKPNSYCYAELHDGIYDHGTIHHDPVEVPLNVDANPRSVFEKTVISVQVIRPLARMGNPTPAAISRAGRSKDLQLSVLTSHPGGKTAWEGDTVTYTLQVANIGKETRSVDASVKENDGLKLLVGENTCSFTVLPGACVEKTFAFRLNAGTEPVCQAPEFVVNDIPVWAERVLVARRMEEDALERVAFEVADCGNAERTLYDRVVSAYAKAGIVIPATPFRLLFPLYRLIDSKDCDVLWRFPQNPASDMALYSYFGGIGVITPELSADMNIRVRKFWPSALNPGDMILVSEDTEFSKVHCLFATKQGLLSQFDGEDICFVEKGEPMDKLIDTLPGRFCYTVFRPEQQDAKALNSRKLF